MVLPIPNLLVVVSQVKLADCIRVPVSLPINIWLAVKDVAPVPPLPTIKVPLLALATFKLVKPDPEPVIIPDNFKLPDISTFTDLLEVPISTCPSLRILKQVALSSWISSISSVPVWLIITAGPVPSFVIFNCSVVFWTVFTCSKVPLTFKSPWILALPKTCNFVSESGSIVPIPTLFLVASIYNIPESILILLDASMMTAPPEHNKPVEVIIPFTSKVVFGLFFPIPNLLLVLFQTKFVGCNIVLLSFPTNIEPDVKVVAPVPPHLTDKTPSVILVAFKDIKLAPDPEIIPDNFILPETSKFSEGLVFPTPTLPEESIVIEL